MSPPAELTTSTLLLIQLCFTSELGLKVFTHLTLKFMALYHCTLSLCNLLAGQIRVREKHRTVLSYLDKTVEGTFTFICLALCYLLLPVDFILSSSPDPFLLMLLALPRVSCMKMQEAITYQCNIIFWHSDKLFKM